MTVSFLLILVNLVQTCGGASRVCANWKDFRKCPNWSLEGNNSVSFWHDTWMPARVPLSEEFPTDDQLAATNIMVSDLVDTHDAWNVYCLRNLVGPYMIEFSQFIV